jgi:autoinducer 2-degrading protein
VTGFVVIVDFRLKPGAYGSFRDMVAANADASVRDEPGCRRFDIVVPRGVRDRVMLYEIYDDEAAFEEHCRSTHFERFDRESAGLVAEKSAILCDLVRNGVWEESSIPGK